MLFCDTAAGGRGDAEDVAIFASQLAALGLAPRVAASAMVPAPGRNLQFDLAPRLVDAGLAAGDSLALLAADRLTDEALVRLRRLADGVEVSCRAFGCFSRRQTALGVRARLAYIFGREPDLYDVSAPAPDIRRPGPVFGVARRAPPPGNGDRGRVPRLLLVGPDLADPLQAATLGALSLRRDLRTAVLTDAKAKQAWVQRNGPGLQIYQYGEILPVALAERGDIAVFFGGTDNSYRLQVIVANFLASGVPLLDGTPGQAITRENDAFIPAPPGLPGLDGYLQAEILPNLARIGSHVRASRAAAAASAGPVLAFLGGEARAAAEPAAPPPLRPQAQAPGASVPPPGRIVFMPTNGVGLGHAQRCALIAGALETGVAPAFAAFPSCLRLLRSHGFDVMPLIGRSQLHAQSHEHDLANYLRLRALTAGARTLVFDGGYVFDSVYRTVLEREVSGVWIRRGLWQTGQDNSVALDREKAFDRVIVPSEAFEELNAAYSRGDHLHSVGPVVQRVALSPTARGDLRDRLADRYGHRFERLVVSLLGAGVAADRSMQIQALCGTLERRSDTLHLVVAWPTATLEPAWFGWRNSRVVRTQHAAVLAVAADLAITAAGYNSFHESLYNRVAAIFIPQTGAFMDDQRARARAARDRDLAAMVEASELMTLERLVNRHLDNGEAEAMRARLAAAPLPEPGTARAARLIEETAHGSEAVERDPVADRPARRG